MSVSKRAELPTIIYPLVIAATLSFSCLNLPCSAAGLELAVRVLPPMDAVPVFPSQERKRRDLTVDVCLSNTSDEEQTIIPLEKAMEFGRLDGHIVAPDGRVMRSLRGALFVPDRFPVVGLPAGTKKAFRFPMAALGYPSFPVSGKYHLVVIYRPTVECSFREELRAETTFLLRSIKEFRVIQQAPVPTLENDEGEGITVNLCKLKIQDKCRLYLVVRDAEGQLQAVCDLGPLGEKVVFASAGTYGDGRVIHIAYRISETALSVVTVNRYGDTVSSRVLDDKQTKE